MIISCQCFLSSYSSPSSSSSSSSSSSPPPSFTCFSSWPVLGSTLPASCPAIIEPSHYERYYSTGIVILVIMALYVDNEELIGDFR